MAHEKTQNHFVKITRDGIIDEDALIGALEAGKVKYYVTDFPIDGKKDHDRVIALPHLGASTAEAEDNCAMMVANQVKDYLPHLLCQLKYRQLRLLICLTYQQYSHSPQPVWLRFDLPYSEYFDVQLPNESPLFSAFLPLENSLNLKYYHFQDSPLLGLQPSSHSCLLPQLLMPLNVLPKGATVLNFARDGIIDEDALISALEAGKVKYYVTDFPIDGKKDHDRVIFSAFLPLENSLNLKYYHFQDSLLLGLQPSSHSCLLPQLLMPLNVAKQSLYRGMR
jgi:hypothetical protein